VLFALVVVVYASLCGLVVGSYLNVVIYRLPRGLSTVLPRSRCPVCGSPIRARDNLPVLSYLLLRGRCRWCGAPIARRYPLIELATGALFAACALRFGPTFEALTAALFCALMIVLAAIDVEHYLLPDRITLPGIVAGLALQPWIAGGDFRAALLGAALGAGVLLAVRAAWSLIRHEEGMGLGDVKMLALIGAFLGWRGAAVAFVVAVVAGAAVGLGLVALRRGGLRRRLPFGLFLAGGGLIALFWGRALSAAYLRLL
jgi:leader peptidase (prepilin peptidase) / N-methyltransferase